MSTRKGEILREEEEEKTEGGEPQDLQSQKGESDSSFWRDIMNAPLFGLSGDTVTLKWGLGEVQF